MSTFRHVNVSSMSPRAHTRETLEFPGSNRCGNTLEFCAFVVHLHQSHRVIIHMNTKMILAAVALSLSLAACAKKEEAAPPADTAAPAETAPAPDAAATGDAASQAGDAASQAPAETPPADQPPAQPQQ
jgi:hypothetical protein